METSLLVYDSDLRHEGLNNNKFMISGFTYQVNTQRRI